MSRYLPYCRIGVGETADVYLGVLRGAEGFRRPVVLKRALSASAGARAHEALVREASIGAALSHPNVVHVYELTEAPEGLLLAMEYVGGMSVRGLLQQVDRTDSIIPWAVAARIAADAARGLHHAHTAAALDGAPLRVVHRDVTPDNLVVTEEGITKVVDFGIAKGGSEHTATGLVRGTPAYVSPEQATGRPVDWRSDVFSLGVVLVELVTLRSPFDRPDPREALRAAAAAEVPALPREVPSVVSDLVRRMTAKDPAHREISMEEVADILEDASAPNGGTHGDVSRFLVATGGATLERRRNRVRSMLNGRPRAHEVASVEAEHTSTMAMLERTLDEPEGIAGLDDDTWVDPTET